MQMFARVLLVMPAAQDWLQNAILEAVAMEFICGSPASDAGALQSVDCTERLKACIEERSTPEATSDVPLEAAFAPSLLYALCSRSMALLASSWVSFLRPSESTIALSLRSQSQLDALNAEDPGPPPHSLVSPQTKPQQLRWMCECLQNIRSYGDGGITSLLEVLDANLPPLTEHCNSALPRSQVEWASATPLCQGDSPAFLSLRHSASARGKTTSALMLLTAALSEVPDSIVTPILTAFHVYTEAAEGGGLGVLVRAVGTAVTWVHSTRAADVRALALGEAHNLSDSTGDLSEAMMLLQHACGALCAAVGALLKIPSSRGGIRDLPPMHARWRVVCHMLLAAYYVIHWLPDNLRVRDLPSACFLCGTHCDA
jgi:hypothetical protein